MKRSAILAFTLEEVLIVAGIIGLLLGLVTMNIFQGKHSSSLNTSVMVLISDLKYQQTKAMLGETEGQTTNDAYGIYFEQVSYTLFRGLNFDSSNSSNFKVNLGDNIVFNNILFPNSQIIFASGSGEINGFDTAYETIILKNTLNNDQKSVKVNKMGVVTEVN